MAASKFPGSSAESSLDAARAQLLFEALRFRHALDLCGGQFATAEDEALLTEATTEFCRAADDYEAAADVAMRRVLGPSGLARERWQR
jgi:hypothetical protein